VIQARAATKQAVRRARDLGTLMVVVMALLGAPGEPASAQATKGVAPLAQPAKSASGGGPRQPQDVPLATLVRSRPLAIATGGLVVALLIADRLVLWKRPRWLLRLPDEGLLLPIGWEKVLPVGSRLFRALKYRDRVLDAWIAAHHGTITRRFATLATVEQRRHHLSLPVKVGQALVPDLTPERLRELGGVGGLVLVSGEGGVGKTSLALRFAGWALEGTLTKRPVVPVLVEADLQGEESLLSRLRSTLAGLMEGTSHEATGSEWMAPAPTLPLVRALLERKRLLVILDHFSELGDESRRRLLPTADDFPSAWTIVTSRRRESFAGKVVLHLEPQRLTADRLWPFFTDYLRLVQAGEALDFDLHQRAVGRLREITAGLVDEQQAITVLLAKLYIDVVLAERRGAGGSLLPASVPALMLTYIRQINSGIEEERRQPRELVVRALQHLAQASEDRLFRPRAVRRDVAMRAIARAIAEREGSGEEGVQPRDGGELLRYLVERLLLVTESPDGEALHLVLDPLADYLAALGWLRQLDREGDGAWDHFFDHTLPSAGTDQAALAQGFLRALYDSALHAWDPTVLGLELEPAMVARLAERASIDPARIAREREGRRLQRLIDDLAEPELAVRLQAIVELCRRRSGEARVTESLGRVLSNGQQELEAREAAAIALAAQGGVAAARALAAALEAPSPVEAEPREPCPAAVTLRRQVLEGLGLALTGLWGVEAGLSEERQRLLFLLEQHLRADALDLLVEGEEGWAEHDRRLPLLQGASRGLQLAAAADLPLLGSGPGRRVPMLTLTALKEGEGLRIRTEVVTPEVWKLPLPECPGAGPQQLELVVVPGGVYCIGSPAEEAGRDCYTQFRQKCEGVNVEAQRKVRILPFALVRHPITQAQWLAVAALPRQECDLNPTPRSFEAKGLWESHAQLGGLAVASVSWDDCQEWLRRLNGWLKEEWPQWGVHGEAPKLALPSESQWEVACRAGASTPFHFGDTLDVSWANYDGGYTYGSGRKGIFRQRPVPVGAFGLVNRWGLAELHGQLSEWCGDQWYRNPLRARLGTKRGWLSGEGEQDLLLDCKAHEGTDPDLSGMQEGTYRLLRGGSWFYGPLLCRAPYRFSNHPAGMIPDVGYRPCCLLPPGSLLGS
jgi:formylglycine-generating enzyme required for sulfatase activity